MKSFLSSMFRGIGRFLVKKLKKVTDSIYFKWTVRILVAFGGFNLLTLAYLFIETGLTAFSRLQIGVDEWTVAAKDYIEFLAGNIITAPIALISLIVFSFWAITKILSIDRRESKQSLAFQPQTRSVLIFEVCIEKIEYFIGWLPKKISSWGDKLTEKINDFFSLTPVVKNKHNH